MGKFCKYCGAMLDSNAKICSNCGKVLTSAQRTASVNGVGQFSRLNQQSMPQQRVQRTQGNQYQPPRPPHQPITQPTRDFSHHPNRKPVSKPPIKTKYSEKSVNRQIKQQRPYAAENPVASKSGSQAKKWIVRGIKSIIALLVVYFVFSFVRIFIVAHSTYDFGLDNVTLPSEDYGDAMSAYFESGHWHCSLTKGVYYTGTHDGDDYEVYFGKKDGKEIVEKLVVNDTEKSSKDLMMTDIMGMFMAE